MKAGNQGVPSSFINALFGGGARISLGYEEYALRSLIGSGGLGVVVKAQKRTGEYVALKFLYQAPGREHLELFERFKQEIKATKMVGDISDACVKVYECGEYKPAEGAAVPFFSMEYVPGLSLEDLIFIKETPFTPVEIYAVMRQIADAIDDIHQKGIVHRDIKPSNILFDEQRKILKVTDFGISKDLSATTQVTMHSTDGSPFILGTLHYLSRYYFETIKVPTDEVREVGLGEFYHTKSGVRVNRDSDGRYFCPYKGKKLDLSVLASTILYELVTRENPYRNSSMPSVINDIIAGRKLDVKAFAREHPGALDPQLVRRSRLLARIDRIIRKGTHPDIRRTYASAAELRRDLDRFVGNAYGRIGSKQEIKKIMINFFGTTLVNEYNKVLTRLENSLRTGHLFTDRGNVQRIVLLYKLNNNERLMQFLETLCLRAGEIIVSRSAAGKECHFLHQLFSSLERFGIQERYRVNMKKLAGLIAEPVEG
jgi:serine/threonine protein kinase